MYIPLYIKTEYSLLKSIIKVKDLVKYAKELNLKSIAICDENLYGSYEFYLECIKNEIKPIIGLEVSIDDHKLLLYAKNNNGYKNLIKISEYEKNVKNLNTYNDDLICILPYEYINKYNDYSKIFKDIYVGYDDIKQKGSINYKSIYVNETLYLNKADKIYYMYLKGIKDETTIDEINISKDYSLKIDEPNSLYNYIYENCNVKFEKRSDLLPSYDVKEGFDSYTYLKEMCRLGLKKHFGESVSSKYIERIKKELQVIKDMNFCDYFLVVMDYVKYAKDNGIIVGPGRGSAAGSLVAYVLEITDVDPLKYNLLFERFLNPARVTMPDIDIDFEFSRREEVINYCINKYGKERVSNIITFGTLASRQVLRDVSKVMDLNQKEVDYFIKLIDSRINLKKNLDNPKIKDILSKNKDFKELYKIALKLEGLKRHSSIHAAGIIISSKNIDEVIPVIKHDDILTAAFTKDYLEDLGLLKMDFLALKNLSFLNDILKCLEKDNINVNIKNIRLDDIKTYELFKNANVNGIFQFESSGMKSFLEKLQPDNIEDLSLALALYRPGPMSNIDTFVKRKKGLQKIEYIDKRLEPILKDTYGIIVYQEQIMKISNVMAGYTLEQADILRRAMSKKKHDMILKEKQVFIEGSINNGYTKEQAIEVYNLILKFSEYGFNKSHAVAYSMISYQLAYLKANFPAYFIKCLLDESINTSNLNDCIMEAHLNNINILNPSINNSRMKFEIEKKGLRFPLSSIKDINTNVVKLILEERDKGKFKDIFDFVGRLYSKVINKDIIIRLIHAGCFDEFKINHRTLIENIDSIINYAILYQQLQDESIKPNLNEYKEYTKKELLDYSYSSFGFYLVNNPVTEIKAKLKQITKLNDIKKNFDKVINVVGIIDKLNPVTTKNNEEMCFIKIFDEFGTADVVLFPKVYKQIDLEQKDIVIIKGRVERRFDKYQLVASDIRKFENKK